jgi:hypothetical protein
MKRTRFSRMKRPYGTMARVRGRRSRMGRKASAIDATPRKPARTIAIKSDEYGKAEGCIGPIGNETPAVIWSQSAKFGNRRIHREEKAMAGRPELRDDPFKTYEKLFDHRGKDLQSVHKYTRKTKSSFLPFYKKGG